MSQSLQIITPQPVAQADNDTELVRLWLRSKQSEKTQTEYFRDLAAFTGWLIKKRSDLFDMRAIKLVHLQDYAESLSARSPNTQRRMLASIKSLFTFAQKLGYIQFNVAAAIQLPHRKNTRAERILSENDVMKMILLESNARNQLLIRLLYLSGARISEVRQLRWRDLQARSGGGQATLYGKRGKTRAVRLPEKLYCDLLDSRPTPFHVATEFLFPRKKKKNGAIVIEPLDASRLWEIVADAAKRAGLQGVSPHWLRHAHASHALERGANVNLVKETLGHESLATTSEYLHARPGESSSTYLIIE